jgi:hypothetical protein
VKKPYVSSEEILAREVFFYGSSGFSGIMPQIWGIIPLKPEEPLSFT